MAKRFGAYPPTLADIMPWSGAGTGDGTVVPNWYDETGHMAFLDRTLYPDWKYETAATGTGTNRYVDPVNGNDTWTGLAPTGSGPTGPYATFGAAWTACATGDASNQDCINILAGTLQTEGERSSMAKNVVIQAYQGARAIFDSRLALTPWTDVDLGGGRHVWWAAYTCAHYAEPNTGNCNPINTSPTTANQAPVVGAVSPDSARRLCVTVDDQIIAPCISNRVWNGSAWATCNVTSITRSGTTATLTTSSAHGLTTGDSVEVYNLSASVTYLPYQGVFTITGTPTSTTFTYTVVVTGTNPATPAAAANATQGIRWVSHHQAAGANVFFHDTARSRLYVGQDPALSTAIKAPEKRWLWSFTSTPTYTIRGIVFKGYANRYNDTSSSGINQRLIALGGTATVENCAFGFTNGDALGVAGTGVRTIRHCAAWWMRSLAAGGGANNVDVHRCYGRFLQWPMAGVPNFPGFHAGILRVLSGATGNIVHECDATYCNTAPYWYDFGGDSNHIVNNRSAYGTKQGASIEVCSITPAGANIVGGNAFTDHYWGMGIIVSSNVNETNNALYRCGLSIKTEDDARRNAALLRIVDAETTKNNVIAGAAGSTLPGWSGRGQWYVRHVTGITGDPMLWWTQHDYNAIHWPPSADADADDAVGFATWFNPSFTSDANWSTSQSITTWLTNTGAFEANGVQNATTEESFYVDPPNDLRVTMQAGSGLALTAAELAVLGPAYGKDTSVVNRKGPRWHPGMRPGGFSLEQSFTRADSTTLQATPETGQAEVAGKVGDHGTSSNEGYSSTDADGDVKLYDARVKHGWWSLAVRGTLNSAATYRVPRLCFKGTAATTYLAFSLQNGAAFFHKVVTGTSTQLATASGLTTTNGTTYALRVKEAGNVLYGYQDGTLVLTHTLSAADMVTYLSGTYAGYDWKKAGSPATAARVDALWSART